MNLNRSRRLTRDEPCELMILRVLCSYKLMDDVAGVVQELSELVLYAVVAVVPALCFAVAPSVRVSRSRAAAVTADETIRLSTVD